MLSVLVQGVLISFSVFVEVWAGVLAPMICARGHQRQVSFFEFKDMASSLHAILVGIHGKSKKPMKVGRFNCMDAMRAILSVLEQF